MACFQKRNGTYTEKKVFLLMNSIEELLVSTGGHGVSQIEVTENSSILDKTIRDADLRSKDITVLSIEKAGKIVPNPAADTKINIGDRLICFGRLENMKEKIYTLSK